LEDVVLLLSGFGRSEEDFGIVNCGGCLLAFRVGKSKQERKIVDRVELQEEE
jgi:hypothetical protein